MVIDSITSHLTWQAWEHSMAKKTPQTKTVARSAVTGKFVTSKYATTHPRTTEVERVKRPRK